MDPMTPDAHGEVPEPPRLARAVVDELRAELDDAAILDPADPTVGRSDLERYVVPARGPAGAAAAVVRPATTEQVRSVVAWARRHHLRLIPQGANTGLVGASTPGAAGEVVLSLERLDPEPRIDPVDRTAVVGAGTRLSTLNDAAAQHGLVLPIDLGADPSIGGMVATNTGGARMVRHGDMRRRVLGLHAVIADDDCSVVGTLDGLRKHNVGPSIEQLLIGSAGAFGIVTTVQVELSVVEPHRSCAWLAPTDDDAAIGALVEIERAHASELSAFEVLSAPAVVAGASRGGHGAPFDPVPPLSVLVEFAGDDDVEDALVDALDRCSQLRLLTDAVVVPPDHAWALRHAVTEGLRDLGVVTGFDLSVPRPALPALRHAVAEAVVGRFPRATTADFGHWGDGGVHCNVVWPPDAPPSAQELDEVRALVFDLVVDRFDGSYSAEHGIGPHNASQWERRTDPARRRMLAALRQVVDPLGVLGHADLPF